MDPPREGPFTIMKILGPVTYQLKFPPQWRIHNRFHADILTPYIETAVHGKNFLEPPPDLIAGEQEWEVVRIKAHKFIRG